MKAPLTSVISGLTARAESSQLLRAPVISGQADSCGRVLVTDDEPSTR